ncbi:MAG: S8 family serine peptidase, partial [Chloroflexi bacterium]|nr:S8 family serine peptidase [Chloroflexota bacterium]
TSASDTRMYFSNMGDWLDVSAPGDYIYSSYYTGTLYSTMRGTSMAAPHVAGLAALVLALRPGWTPDQVREHIQVTADDVTSYGIGWDDKTGWGRVNAQRAVAALLSEASTAAPARASTPASSPEASAAPAVPADPAEYAPGEVLYKLRAGVQPAEVLATDEFAVEGVSTKQAVTAADVWVLHVPAGQERLWLERLRADAQVEFAELNGIMHIE